MINQFLNKIHTVHSENTWKTYSNNLKRLFPNGQPVLTAAYLLTRIQELNLSRNTIKNMLVTYSQFLQYVNRNQQVGDYDELVDIMKSYKGSDVIKGSPSVEQVDLLLDSITNSKYQAICLLMSQRGLRVSEVLGIKISDLSPTTVVIRNTKNKQDSVIRLSMQIQRAIQDYLPERLNTCEYLFTTRNGKINVVSAQQTIRRYMDNCGMQEFSAHSLRHSYAQRLIDNHVDMPVVQRALRHKSISSTQRYFEISNERLNSELQRVFN